MIETYGIKSELACPINQGDPYLTIEDVTTIEKPDEKVKLEHKQGEVWLLDFWATWCPPCQRPMAHNQEMLKKNGDAWKEKNIRIIGLSIDKEAGTVVKHVTTKGWTDVEHFHRAGSNYNDTYQVRGVPCVMLIDQNGKIVFKGHPASRPDLEQDLNDLAEGKEIAVEKKEEAEAPPVAEQEGEDEKKVDVAVMHSEMDSFKKDVAPQLQKDLKEGLEGF